MWWPSWVSPSHWMCDWWRQVVWWWCRDLLSVNLWLVIKLMLAASPIWLMSLPPLHLIWCLTFNFNTIKWGGRLLPWTAMYSRMNLLTFNAERKQTTVSGQFWMSAQASNSATLPLHKSLVIIPLLFILCTHTVPKHTHCVQLSWNEILTESLPSSNSIYCQ